MESRSRCIFVFTISCPCFEISKQFNWQPKDEQCGPLNVTCNSSTRTSDESARINTLLWVWSPAPLLLSAVTFLHPTPTDLILGDFVLCCDMWSRLALPRLCVFLLGDEKARLMTSGNAMFFTGYFHSVLHYIGFWTGQWLRGWNELRVLISVLINPYEHHSHINI